MAGNYRWTGQCAGDVITGGWLNGLYWNVSPCCGADSGGNAWSPALRVVGENVVELHFYRGHKDNLLSPSGWQSKGHIDFMPVGDYSSCFGWAGLCMLTDDRDTLFAWWHRNAMWRATHQTADALQGVRGTIDPDTGELSLDSPVDLGIPYVQGFGVDYTPPSNGIEMDPDGYLWIVTSPQIIIRSPVLELLYGDDLLVGTHRYAFSYYDGSGGNELGCGRSWPVTTLAQAQVPGAPDDFSSPGPGGIPAGRHWFRLTFFKEDGTSGDGESTAGPASYYDLSTDNRSIRMRLRRALRNGGRKV